MHHLRRSSRKEGDLATIPRRKSHGLVDLWMSSKNSKKSTMKMKDATAAERCCIVWRKMRMCMSELPALTPRRNPTTNNSDKCAEGAKSNDHTKYARDVKSVIARTATNTEDEARITCVLNVWSRPIEGKKKGV